MSDNRINCSICGESIDETFAFCPSCGAKVENLDKGLLEPGNPINIKSEKNYSAKKNSKGTNKDISDKKEVVKSISPIKLFYIIFGLIIVGFVFLFASGIFDKPIPITDFGQQKVEDFHRGVDLSSLQRINSLEEKVKNDPNDHASLIDLAHLLNDSGFKEKAIEKYKIYLKAHPDDADVLVDMGVCYYEMANYDEALKWMKEALKYQPKHQIAHLNIGIVSLTSGNHDEAIGWLKKANEIDPNNNIGKRAQELINSH